MSEKADFEAEVKAVEEFQRVCSCPCLTYGDVLMASNPVSRGRLDHTLQPMLSQKGEHYPSRILLM